ncbi:hypothetical protein EVAR_8975_1 [Eumeta japonica]|uniref:ATP-dependent DNA helicase n=1 Tax=Eumeta variegata TaxID=151549 RepID=A0A4C1WP86_EUMVA|nr:hypothetical protein EVAR_8975_1 [Eumeta japonica]
MKRSSDTVGSARLLARPSGPRAPRVHSRLRLIATILAPFLKTFENILKTTPPAAKRNKRRAGCDRFQRPSPIRDRFSIKKHAVEDQQRSRIPCGRAKGTAGEPRYPRPTADTGPGRIRRPASAYRDCLALISLSTICGKRTIIQFCYSRQVGTTERCRRARRDKPLRVSAPVSGGRTAHSVLKLPLNLAHEETPICNISKSSEHGRMLQQCKLLVWDECTMAHKRAIEAQEQKKRIAQ